MNEFEKKLPDGHVKKLWGRVVKECPHQIEYMLEDYKSFGVDDYIFNKYIVASLTGYTPKTIQNYMRLGKIKCVPKSMSQVSQDKNISVQEVQSIIEVFGFESNSTKVTTISEMERFIEENKERVYS